MPIDAGTLQRIAQGGPLLKRTLAGQIADRRRAAQAQQFEMRQSLMEQMRKQAATESEMRRRAYTTYRERMHDQQSRMFGLARKLLTEAQSTPDAVRQSLMRAPGVASALGVDPNSPNFLTQLRGAHDRLRAIVTSDIPDPSAKSKQQTSLRLPDGTQTQGYFDPEDGNWYAKTEEGWVEAPAGTMEITAEGSLEDLGLTEKTKGALEEEITKADKALQRLEGIEEAFKPEYQQSWTRLGFAWDAGKEKAGVDLTPGEEEELSDYAEFRQRAANNINLYIKEITGAQMSEAEAERLRKAAPDPGDGIFDGDSPTQFRSKMDAAMKIARATRARAQWALENGLMDELKEKAEKEEEMTGKFDLDNFMEEDDPVESFINEVLGE